MKGRREKSWDALGMLALFDNCVVDMDVNGLTG